MIKIETDIPLPIKSKGGAGNTSDWTRAARSLEIGHSFVAETPHAVRHSARARLYSNLRTCAPFEFKTSYEMTAGGIRVWRTA